MTQLNVVDAPRGERGGYKVDVNRGERLGRVSSEWFSRPADERYLSLAELHAAVRGRAERSRTRTVESTAIRVEASRADVERLTLLLPSEEVPLAPTHWSFGQLTTMVGAPSTYLRQLPAPLAAINLQYGLSSHRAEQIKTLEVEDGRVELRAVTGPDYGRIYDHELVSAVQRIAGNGTGDTRWKVPGVLDWSTGVYNPHVDITKSTTTLYASDRDVFLFLVDELYSTDHHNVADGLTTLPQDYAGIAPNIPKLGPPLPGDLQHRTGTAEGQPAPLALDAEQQRANQETEAARTSRLFASTTASVAPPHAPSQATANNTGQSSDETFTQSGQDRKLLFVNANVDRRTTAPDRILRPASPFVIQSGTIIPAALITGLRSDLPGQIAAQVTENVYDSPTGRFLLIPQGTRLIGIYDSQIAAGQSRVLLVWTRLIMPNGRSIILERQSGADAAGYSGLEDVVDNHWGALFKAALLSTLLGVGSELGSTTGAGSNSDVITALRRGSSDSLNQTGQKVVQQNLNGPVAGLVGIEGGVVSEVINLESSGVEAPDRRPRHEQQYH